MKRTLNMTINRSTSAKNDEHYTQFASIQKEVNDYLDYDTSGATDIKNCKMLCQPHN